MKFDYELISQYHSFNSNLRSSMRLILTIFSFLILVYLFVGLIHFLDLKKAIFRRTVFKGNNSKINKVNENLLDFHQSFHLINSSFLNQTSKDAQLIYSQIYPFETNSDNRTIFDHSELNFDSKNGLFSRSILKRTIRSLKNKTKLKKNKSLKSAKRKIKVKRLVFRIERFPFLKLFATSKVNRKRFIRRNVRSSLKFRFNRPKVCFFLNLLFKFN